jgi:hypothetical protein
MINFFENDYSIPVILGSGTCESNAAELITKCNNKKVHIFSEKLSVLKRVRYTFHKIPKGERLLINALSDFADSVHEYNTPILVYGTSFSDFVANNLLLLESKYITIPVDEVEKYFTKTPKE